MRLVVDVCVATRGEDDAQAIGDAEEGNAQAIEAAGPPTSADSTAAERDRRGDDLATIPAAQWQVRTDGL